MIGKDGNHTSKQTIMRKINKLTFFIVVHFMMPETARAGRINIVQVAQPEQPGIVQIVQPAQPKQPSGLHIMRGSRAGEAAQSPAASCAVSVWLWGAVCWWCAVCRVWHTCTTFAVGKPDFCRK